MRNTSNAKLKNKLDRHDDMEHFEDGDGLFKNWCADDSDSDNENSRYDLDERIKHEKEEINKTDSDSCSAVSSSSSSSSKQTERGFSSCSSDAQSKPRK